MTVYMWCPLLPVHRFQTHLRLRSMAHDPPTKSSGTFLTLFLFRFIFFPGFYSKGTSHQERRVKNKRFDLIFDESHLFDFLPAAKRQVMGQCRFSRLLLFWLVLLGNIILVMKKIHIIKKFKISKKSNIFIFQKILIFKL